MNRLIIMITSFIILQINHAELNESCRCSQKLSKPENRILCFLFQGRVRDERQIMMGVKMAFMTE